MVVLMRPTFTKSESMAKSREKTDDSVILSLSALVAFGEREIDLIYKSRKHSLSLGWAAFVGQGSVNTLWESPKMA